MSNEKKNSLENLTGFTSDELNECRLGNKLLGIGLELTRACNLCCIYCYANSGKPLKNEMSFNEIINIIEQAITLGVRKIGLIGGGETLLYSKLKDLISYISKYPQVKTSVFTNGTLIDQMWIEFFSLNNVSIVHKLNSFNESVQDKLSGIKGSYKKIQKSLNLFLNFQYQKKHSFTVESVLLKDNLKEIPKIWRWARSHGITPLIERLTPQGRGESLEQIPLTSEVQTLFEQLSVIDKNEFNLDWEAHPPIAGHKGCLHHFYAIYIKSDGTIQPCSGISLPIGNIRSITLAHSIQTEPIRQLRNLSESIKGKCKFCKFSNYCYGCRGASFQIFRDYLEEDPYCWKSIS